MKKVANLHQTKEKARKQRVGRGTRLVNYLGSKAMALPEIHAMYHKAGCPQTFIEPFAGFCSSSVNLLSMYPQTKAICIEKNPVIVEILHTFQQLCKRFNGDEIMDQMESVVSLKRIEDPDQSETYYAQLLRQFNESTNSVQRSYLFYWISLLSMNQSIQFQPNSMTELAFSFGKAIKLGPKQRKYTIDYLHQMKEAGDRLKIVCADGLDYLKDQVDQQEVKKSFFMIDSPYGKKDEDHDSFLMNYDYAWTEGHNQQLLNLILKLKNQQAKFMVFNQEGVSNVLFHTLREKGLPEYLIDRQLGHNKRKDVFMSSHRYIKLSNYSKRLVLLKKRSESK